MDILSSRMQSTNIGSSSARLMRRTVATAQVVNDATTEWSCSLLGKISTPLNHDDIRQEINMLWSSYK
ncbi:hypothetical protein MKX01_002902, partial [Papaver californicum]